MLPRIEITDGILSATIKMSNGDTSAVLAMTRMVAKSEEIDPDNVLGGIGAIMHLDSFEIYGEAIGHLYQKTCGGDIRRLLLIIRTCQLGHMSVGLLQGLSLGTHELDEGHWALYEANVLKDLPGFQKK
ncbi:MAG: hypothetical protein COA47_10285 [Robiginitomaculum sp.]|nr:MAG: hypothetical protein COA47_10285 [Robiginitomaculum sp.]